eukprot:g69868.t1
MSSFLQVALLFYAHFSTSSKSVSPFAGVFEQVLRSGRRLKVKEIPLLVHKHLRGTSIVRNSRPRSWRWWDGPNGRDYAEACARLTAQRHVIFFLPHATPDNCALRCKFGPALFAAMHRQQRTGSVVKALLYHPHELVSHAEWLHLTARPLPKSTEAFDLTHLPEPCAAAASLPTPAQHKPGQEPVGSLADLMIVDDAYVQLKLNGLPPMHSATSAEVATCHELGCSFAALHGQQIQTSNPCLSLCGPSKTLNGRKVTNGSLTAVPLQSMHRKDPVESKFVHLLIAGPTLPVVWPQHAIKTRAPLLILAWRRSPSAGLQRW